MNATMGGTRNSKWTQQRKHMHCMQQRKHMQAVWQLQQERGRGGGAEVRSGAATEADVAADFIGGARTEA